MRGSQIWLMLDAHVVFPLPYLNCISLLAIAEVLPRFIEEPQSQVVRHESKVTLTCKTEPGNLPITWLFNGDPVPSNSGIQVDGGSLVITSFRHRPRDRAHVGKYQCVAQNSAGVVHSSEALLEKASAYHVLILQFNH